MKKLALSLLLVVVAAGCSLRPRYNDYRLMADVMKEARFVVVDPDNKNAPIAGAKVEMGENKNKVTTTSDATGGFMLPVDKRYADDNSLIVVTLPKGFKNYEVQLAPPPAPELPPAPPADAAVMPIDSASAPETNATDAGTPLAVPVQAR
jgi:hypothetical protein